MLTTLCGWANEQDRAVLDDQGTETSQSAFGSKRLLSISRTDKYGTNKGDIKYYEDGRVKEYHVNGMVYKYSYSGNQMSIDDSEDGIYTFEIQNGKLATGKFQYEDYREELSFYYDDSDRFIKLSNTAISDEGSETIDMTYTWNNNNLATAQVEGFDVCSYSYNTLTSEPIIHALFGFGLGYPPEIEDDVFENIAFYPYIGVLPENLFSETIVNYDGEYAVFNYSYETDTNGNITKVIASGDGETIVYDLSWSESETSIIDTSNNPSKELPLTIYDLQGRKVVDGGNFNSLKSLPHCLVLK